MSKCITPFYHKSTGLSFPCNKCIHCLNRRASGWSFRLRQESQLHEEKYFVTYTYSNEKVHITNNAFSTLVKTDFQDYMAQLRKKMPMEKIGKLRRYQPVKYYLAGEYGTQSYRPHYHAILFSVKLELIIGVENAIAALTNKEFFLKGKYEFTHPSWPHGYMTVGEVNEASIGYCLKYISKLGKIPLHENDDRLPEFQLCSKGLGKNYITKQTRKYHNSDLVGRVYLTIENQKKIAMPRYYKQKIYTQLNLQNIGKLTEIQEDIKTKELMHQMGRKKYLQYLKSLDDIRIEDYQKGNRKTISKHGKI